MEDPDWIKVIDQQNNSVSREIQTAWLVKDKVTGLINKKKHLLNICTFLPTLKINTESYWFISNIKYIPTHIVERPWSTV